MIVVLVAALNHLPAEQIAGAEATGAAVLVRPAASLPRRRAWLALRWGSLPRTFLTGFSGRRLDLLAGRDRGLHKDSVVPDYRRSRTAAGNSYLPFDIVGFAPSDGRIGMRSNAVLERPAPLRPILFGG